MSGVGHVAEETRHAHGILEELLLKQSPYIARWRAELPRWQRKLKRVGRKLQVHSLSA